MRVWIFKILVPVLSFAICYGVYAVFWERYRERIEKYPPHIAYNYDVGPVLPRELLHDVGFFLNSRRRSEGVALISPKKQGTIRIAAFGDSYTFGDEVDDGFDFPSLLRKKLQKKGKKEIEILNFGNSWFGFHQSYRIWEYLRPQIEPDFILLGPACFQPERDLTFHHSGDSIPEYIHGRYVLTGSGSETKLRFLRPPGQTSRGRFAEYFRSPPHWDLVRHDRNAPPALRALFPTGHSRTNPFYFSSLSPREEAGQIFEVMLQQIADQSQGVVLINSEDWVTEIGTHTAAASSGHLVSAKLPPIDRFPYFALGHYSPMGNDLIAEAYLAALNGEKIFELPLLQFGDGLPPQSTNEKNSYDLSSFNSIEAKIGDVGLGVFVHTHSPELEYLRLVDFSKNGIKGLLGLVGDQMSPLDAMYLPLDKPLSPSDQVTVSFEGENKKTWTSSIRLPKSNLPIGFIRIPEIQKVPRLLTPSYELIINSERTRIAAVEVFLNDRRIYRSEPISGTPYIRLDSSPLLPIQLRPRRNSYLDVQRLSDVGVLDLHFFNGENKNAVARTAFTTWKIKKEKFGLPTQLKNHLNQ